MAAVNRIHCHSAFKHYEMFHCNQSSSYGNSVFNTTYNFNGGNICGGGFWGGLLGGLGMGLGAGIMNFLGGGFSGGFFGGGGMFGGFPMMNMFSGGGFSPMSSFWGLGGRTAADGAGGKDKTTECKDHDREKILDFDNKLIALSEKDKIIKEEYDELKTAIEQAKKDSDDNHKSTDDKSYDNLIKRLGKLESKIEKTTPEGATPSTETPVEQTPEGATPQGGPTPVEEVVDVKKLTLADTQQIIDNIDNIKEKDAIKILGNRCDEDSEIVFVPRNYAELLLAQKTGFDIQFCFNPDQSEKSDKSDNIVGKIKENTIQPDENDNNLISYVVVSDGDGEYKMLLDSNEKTITINEVLKKPSVNGIEIQNKLDNVTYEIKNYNDKWAERGGPSGLYN